MNVALIFAGGTGQRMNSKTLPKQFLELHGKPIIIYTLEQFEYHNEIDAIVIVCVDGWHEYLNNKLNYFGIKKVKSIVSGGKTGQESIKNGIDEIHKLYEEDTIVLIHDGVRPIIDNELISKNIACVKKNGNSITISPATETIVRIDENDKINTVIDRNKCRIAKAPQCFYLKDIYNAHNKAYKENKLDYIDSASLMKAYGYQLYTVEGSAENIKITTPVDFYIFRAIIDAKENSQIFGL